MNAPHQEFTNILGNLGVSRIQGYPDIGPERDSEEISSWMGSFSIGSLISNPSSSQVFYEYSSNYPEFRVFWRMLEKQKKWEKLKKSGDIDNDSFVRLICKLF